MEAIQLRIKGKVQGVFFRVTAKEVADELGIKGWVKNTPEGDVLILASGEAESLEKFRQWCRQGPAKARVDDVTESTVPDTALARFEVIRGE